MIKEFNIIFFTIVIALIIGLILASFNTNIQQEPTKIKTSTVNTPLIKSVIPETVIEEKVYKKYEMGNYR
jgi:hypothetical protein